METKDRRVGVFDLISAALCLIADFLCFTLSQTSDFSTVMMLYLLLALCVGFICPPAFIIFLLILTFLPLLEFVYLTFILIMIITGIWLLFKRKRGIGTRILLANIIVAKIWGVMLFCFFATSLIFQASLSLEMIGLGILLAIAVTILVISIVLDCKLTAQLKGRKKIIK